MKTAFISFDPSISSVGYARGIIAGKHAEIYDFGVFRPPRDKTMIDRTDLVVDRIMTLLSQAQTWASVSRAQELVGVVEVPSGRVNRNRHQGGGSGLSTYGFAAGAVYNTMRLSGNCSRILVIDEGWTGSHGKDKRIAVAMKAAPDYNPKDDRGADIADAICMAVFLAARGDFKPKT